MDVGTTVGAIATGIAAVVTAAAAYRKASRSAAGEDAAHVDAPPRSQTKATTLPPMSQPASSTTELHISRAEWEALLQRVAAIEALAAHSASDVRRLDQRVDRVDREGVAEMRAFNERLEAVKEIVKARFQGQAEGEARSRRG